MDLGLRVNIELDKPTNYIILGWWNSGISYKLSDAGIPVVKIEDDSAAGFSAYSLLVEESTAGMPPPNSEWKLVETAEFLYMINAYIERLQFEAARGGGFEIENGYFRSIAENTGGNPMIKLDGTDGSGHLAAGNISWDAAGNTEFKGKIDAISGVIGGFSIGVDSLQAISGSNSMYLSSNRVRFLGQYSSVFIGADTFPGSGGGAILCPQRISIDRTITGTTYGNVGMYFDIRGSKPYDDSGLQYTGNHALYIVNGTIVGFRPRVRRVSTSQTLSTLDTVIFCVARSAKITLTLPTNAEDGQIYFIKKATSPDFVVQAGSGDVLMCDSETSNYTVSNKQMLILIYDKHNRLWMSANAHE